MTSPANNSFSDDKYLMANYFIFMIPIMFERWPLYTNT